MATVDVLVVAGGGGGGGCGSTWGIGAGGGGGGLVEQTGRTVVVSSYTVTVGGGGAGGAAGFNAGVAGSNSVFDTITALGGGGGGTFSVVGSTGGSGSGGQNGSSGLAATQGDSGGGTGYGFAGGDGAAFSGSGANSMGGGGGAGGVGSNGTAPSGTGGNGGAGRSSSISGSAQVYGSGGGGAKGASGTGGIGGTNAGSSGSGGNGSSATANFGGGGGAANSSGNNSGGNGGSGVVIVSYPTSSMSATGGTITTSGGNTIHTFTSSGTFQVISSSISIAFDAFTNRTQVTGTSITMSHTCSTVSNRILWVGVGVPTADSITGVTYGGVAMTQVNKRQGPAANGRYTYLYYLLNPASGANNVVASASGSEILEVCAASYTGARQSGVPDAQTTNTATGATSITTSVTTVADNSWAVIIGRSTTALAASTGVTSRGNIASDDTTGRFGDSGGALTPAGSKSMTLTCSSGDIGVCMASFAPAIDGNTGNFFLIM